MQDFNEIEHNNFRENDDHFIKQIADHLNMRKFDRINSY
jgi:hypothetical protein